MIHAGGDGGTWIRVQYKTILVADIPRVNFEEHGVDTVSVPWAEPGSGFTALFEALVIDWLKEASTAAVSRLMGLSWNAIDAVMRRAGSNSVFFGYGANAAMTRSWLLFHASAALLVDEVLPRRPMRQWVLRVPYQLRFLLARDPQVMGRVLGIVYRAIKTYLIHKAGLTRTKAHTGAVTLIQCFGGALNLHIHFHMLFLDGVYVTSTDALTFRRANAPNRAELDALIERISQRVGRYLERAGLLVRDTENSYLTLESTQTTAMDDLLGHSVTYRIAVGPRAGRKAFTLQTLPPSVNRRAKMTHLWG